MKKTYYLFLTALIAVASLSLASCSDDDDDDYNNISNNSHWDTNCLLCWKTITGGCTVNGVSYHCETEMAQSYANSTFKPYVDFNLHRDGGEDLWNTAPEDWPTIDLQIGSITLIDDLTVGQTLELDYISYWYYIGPISSGFNEISYNVYVSGSITCTKRNGKEATLTFKNIVLQNKQDDTDTVTINGELVCYDFDYYD